MSSKPLENEKQSSRRAADVRIIETVDEVLSTIQKLTSNVKKPEAPAAAATSAGEIDAGAGVAVKETDILELTDELVWNEPQKRAANIRETELVRGKRGHLGAMTKRGFADFLVAADKPGTSNSLPRSTSEDISAKAALRRAPESRRFPLQQSLRSGGKTGVAVVGRTAATETRRTATAAQHLGPQDVGGLASPESREIVGRLDAITEELTSLSTRIGALEELIERSLGKPPSSGIWKRRQTPKS